MRTRNDQLFRLGVGDDDYLTETSEYEVIDMVCHLSEKLSDRGRIMAAESLPETTDDIFDSSRLHSKKYHSLASSITAGFLSQARWTDSRLPPIGSKERRITADFPSVQTTTTVFGPSASAILWIWTCLDFLFQINASAAIRSKTRYLI
jgi:hypothetical protein